MVDLKGKLLKIIAAWNLSSNNDSNFIDKDEKAGPFDVLDPRYGCFDLEIYKDNNQANFTFDFSEVPVYTWQLWDEYDLFQAVLVRLDSSILSGYGW